MSKIRKQWSLVASMILLILGTAVPVCATAPDATLFTTYEINNAHTQVSLFVCGSTQQSSGCFGGAILEPFRKVGALLEGNAQINSSTNTVTRAIYVLDIATGSNRNDVTLYVYKKTDAVSSSDDTVTVTLSKTISLPLVGGSTALASMAASTKFLVVGTNKSPDAVKIQKATFAMTQLGGFSPPINVTAITADPYGYVTITFGSFNTTDNAFIVLGPDGGAREDGGGADFMLNSVQAVLPSTFH